MSSLQHIIWPWDTKRWPDLKNKICGQPITSIVEMDMKISSVIVGKLFPRQISEMFTRYYTDDVYAAHRVPQDYFVGKVIPWMQEMVAKAPKTFMHYDGRMLFPSVATNIALSRPQVATIIICMWFGLFNYDYISKVPKGTPKTVPKYSLDDFSIPLFIPLFSGQNIFALQCMIRYFTHVYEQMHDSAYKDTFNQGQIIFKRELMGPEPPWQDLNIPICHVDIIAGTADMTPANMYIACAHQFIGGDFFRGSLTQEEVMLLIRPECIAAVLLCAQLGDDESLTVLGTERLSAYSGNGSSVKYTGPYNDITPRGRTDSENMIRSVIVFIDASQQVTPRAQFNDDFVRDLNKAFCGMKSVMSMRTPPLLCSTTNWTYGFNGNNMQLKFIQLVLAASACGKNIAYHPFSYEFADCINTFVDWMEQNNITVGQLFNSYVELIASCGRKSRFNELDVFDCIMDLDS